MIYTYIYWKICLFGMMVSTNFSKGCARATQRLCVESLSGHYLCEDVVYLCLDTSKENCRTFVFLKEENLENSHQAAQ